MVVVECPFCSDAAQVEGQLDAVACAGCGVTTEVVDASAAILDVAA
jgi:hypothetical protein